MPEPERVPALISHRHPDAPIAWARGRYIRALDYLAAARHMADRLPGDVPVLNLCSRRHHFAVTLSAALLRGVPLLLPSSRTAEALRQLGEQYPGLHVVVDAPGDSAGLPQIVYERGPIPADDAPYDVPDIPADQIAAYIFTSGSTGLPLAHPKRWGRLVRCAEGAGLRLRSHVRGSTPFTVTGTVPAQHMFGFELTVVMPLVNEGVIDASHPFYPADIAGALTEAPAPRVLVSTPFHLRTLVESGVAPPAADLVLCATAPLSSELAKQVEAQLQAPLLEIYGSTETGQLATRRSAQGESWQTVDRIEIEALPAAPGEEPRFLARGGHLEGDTPLGDVLELLSPTRFNLLGRHADLVNIAGKRSSLAHLTHQIHTIPGVVDAALFWPQSAELDQQARVARPVAFVVAPSFTEAALMQALRDRIDPAFMPRRVHFLDALPRNSTGKLPQQVLAELATALRSAAPVPAPRIPKADAVVRSSPVATPMPAPATRWRPTPLVAGSALLHGIAVAGLFTPAWAWSLGALMADHALVTLTGLWPRSHALGPNLTRLDRKEAVIALTIDDGPDPEVTPRVLDALDAAGLRATFFCIGEQVRQHPSLARAIVQRGHALGNHSQHHRHHFSLMGPGALRREIGAAQDTLAQATGVVPRWFRAPAGLRNVFLDPVLHGLGLQLASWTRRGFDTRTGDSTRVLQRLTQGLEAGDILLLHDRHAARTPGGQPVLLEVLPALAARLRAQGLGTATLPSPHAPRGADEMIRP